MAKEKIKRPGYGKLLDYWTPPEGTGEPVGCIATTFTFSPVFFEEECLSRFLKLETDPNDNTEDNGPLYLIEREEKLSNIMCAAALVDQHHCKGPRSLRWDLLSCRLPSKSLLHAKISLLHWSNLTRLIIASANLTEDGYRRNQEILGVLDYSPKSLTPLACLTETIVFLRDAASYAAKDSKASPALERWNKFLDRVKKTSTTWGSSNTQNIIKSVVVHTIFTGSNRPSAFRSLSDVWRKHVSSAPATKTYITSPFFDPPEAENKPAKEIWDFLKQKGKVRVYYYVTAEEVSNEKGLFIHAPQSLVDTIPKNRSNVKVHFRRLDENQPTVDGKTQFRPLHLKNLWVEHDHSFSYMIGSSNFTSAGLGLSASPNLEANLVYSVYYRRNRDFSNAIEKAFLEGKEIDSKIELRWKTKPNEDDAPGSEIILLHPAFGQAVYDCDGKNKPFIKFTFVAKPPAEWEIRKEDSAELIFSEVLWRQSGSKDNVEIPWLEEKPPSGFEVVWKDSKGAAWWPVNIQNATVLPPPEELRDLPLEVLIDILTSARPLHKAIQSWLRHRKSSLHIEEKPLIDPHKRVGTSMFLLQRTRRVSQALTALRLRLERPISTLESLKWRLYGPVGVFALAKAIMKESSQQEQSFFLTELALELSRVRPKEHEGCVSPAVIKKKIKLVIGELKKNINKDSLQTIANLKEYVVSVFKEVG